MYHFLHKHRHWLAAIVVISVVAIFYFQMKGDPGLPVNPNQPKEKTPAQGTP